MTREDAIERLKSAQLKDPESGHQIADDVLVALLTSLGYADVVAEWEKVGKWYA